MSARHLRNHPRVDSPKEAPSMHHRTAEAPETTGRVLRRARLYDLLSRKMSFGRDRLIHLAAPAPGENVLDVGCGTGTLAIALNSMVAPGEVHGIDASPQMIEVAKRSRPRPASTSISGPP